MMLLFKWEARPECWLLNGLAKELDLIGHSGNGRRGMVTSKGRNIRPGSPVCTSPEGSVTGKSSTDVESELWKDSQ